MLIELTIQEIKEASVKNYYRGFKACLIIVVIPMLIAFGLYANEIIRICK